MDNPWNYGNETTKNWSVQFSCSGAVDCPTADQEATALDLWQPISSLTGASCNLSGWDHYPIGSSTHDNSMSYVKGTHVGSSNGYPSGAPNQQLEVCILAYSHVGQSSKGRPTYLRKWIHNVQSDGGENFAPAATIPVATLFEKWDNGAGPHNLVPVSPTTGAQGAPWNIEAHLFTHQLRRSPKRKVAIDPGNISGEIAQIAKILGGYSALYELVGALI
jgi:hypothetical protein